MALAICVLRAGIKNPTIEQARAWRDSSAENKADVDAELIRLVLDQVEAPYGHARPEN
jgi:hypothetical protein